MKRFVSLLLGACLLFTLALTDQITAKAQQEIPEGSVSTGVSAQELTDEAKAFLRYDPPVTLTQNQTIGDNLMKGIPKGYTVEDNDGTRWAYKELGIVWKAKWIAPSPEVNLQKMNLAIASGDLPDILACNGNLLPQLVESGMVVAYDDLIEKYGSPLTKYIIARFNEVSGGTFSSSYTYNGKIYGLPALSDIWASVWFHNWIRQDLLAELGQELPKTVEEMETVIAAYKAKYPDGIGLLIHKSGETIVGMDTVMQAFHAYPNRWIEEQAGELVYGSIQPEVKQGLAVLRDWYAKGWLDQEFVVKDQSKAFESASAGDILIMHSGWWNVWFPFVDMMNNNPQADPVALPPLQGPDGSQKMVLSSPYSAGGEIFAISSKCEHPEAIILQLNLELDSYSRSYENIRKIMKEEYDYEFHYPVTEYRIAVNAEETSNTNEWIFDYPEEITGPRYVNGWPGYRFGILLNWCTPTELVDMYLKIAAQEEDPSIQLTPMEVSEKKKYTNPPNRWPALRTSVKLYEQMWDQGSIYYNQFTGIPTATMVDKNAYLNKIELETFAKIIMGELPLDSFDDFVEQWQNVGGADITKEVNIWYGGIK